MTPPIGLCCPPSGALPEWTPWSACDGTVVEELEWSAGPGWSALPQHRHRWDERYEILDGRAFVVVEGAGRVYCEGESVIVVSGQAHSVEPVEGHGIRLRVQRCATAG